MLVLKDFTLQQIDLLSQLGEVSGVRDLARKNRMDPAAITRLIQDLEEAIGFPIALRTKRGLDLTSEGRDAVSLAKEIIGHFKKIDSLKRVESEFAKYPVVTLSSRGFLTSLIAEALTRSPIPKLGTRFRFLDSSPSDLFKAALAGTVDVAVHLERWNWPSSWISENASTVTWGLVGNIDHPLPERIRVKQTQKYPFVGASFLQNDRVERSDDIFPLKWSERKIGHESQTATTSKAILRNSEHLAFLPLVTVAEELRLGKLKLFQVTDMHVVQMQLRMSVNQDTVTKKTFEALKQVLREIQILDESLGSPLKTKKGEVEKRVALKVSL